MAKYITLDEVINKELTDHPELKEDYQNEMLINAISKMIVEMRNRAGANKCLESMYFTSLFF